MIPVAWNIARREFRGGLRGFCLYSLPVLALGVGAIAAMGLYSQPRSIAGLETRGRNASGGDAELRSPSARRKRRGTRLIDAFAADVSEVYDFRSMAVAGAGGEDASGDHASESCRQRLSVVGEMRLDPPLPLSQSLDGAIMACPGGVMEPILADRLGLADWRYLPPWRPGTLS